MLIVCLVALPFLLAPVAGLLGRRPSWALTFIPLSVFLGALSLSPAALQEPLVEVYRWAPSLGVRAAFRLDGLSLVFTLLITGIGTTIFLYASKYLHGEPRLGRFFVTLTLFMGAMLGAVLSDDLLLLTVFWELTSLTSFLLIGFHPEREEARSSARQGLLVTVGGGLAMLAGVILLGEAYGTFSLSEIMAKPALPDDARSGLIIVLMCAGAFTKSAQFPFHFWLPNAMVAPTPVSAFLHSATMVKLGVYLLARLRPALGGHSWWEPMLVTIGALTMLSGALLALGQRDLKRILAYSTVVSLGTLVLLLGLPGDVAAFAALTFLVVHALYKACLFMVAGIIDHATGTRDVTQLRGLRHRMPKTALVAALGALSMAGLPPFLGFAGKELMYEAALAGASSWRAMLPMVLSNAAMVLVAALVAYRCFAGRLGAVSDGLHDPHFAMWVGPSVLSVLGLVAGLGFTELGESLLKRAVEATTGRVSALHPALFHGLTPMLAWSVVTLAIGAVLYARWEELHGRMHRVTEALRQVGPERFYALGLAGLEVCAKRLSLWMQPGSLRVYLRRTLLVVSLGTFAVILGEQAFQLPSFSHARIDTYAFAAAITAAAFAVLLARSFMAAIVAAGTVGFSIALVFLYHGAPDLAFTQFSVETLSVVILLAIVGRMPFRTRDHRTPRQRGMDAAVSVLFGAVMTMVLWTALAQPMDTALTDYFRATSYPVSHGRNLVNVIIVDFRGFDTLGEITVLTLATIAAYAVVTGAKRHASKEP
jgi:multicomponent Na+:H+ antiporter subunit A